ncbi:MAG TPA: hypothetical protein VHF50_02105 [Solirubrobacterales bacterium]|nr:hypothetical protein [Solirubrobacterales bacterium]
MAVVKLSSKPPRLGLFTVGPQGGRGLRLAGGGLRSRPLVNYFSPVSWSPDGATVAFSGVVGFKGGDGAEPIAKLFLVGADGTGLRPIRGTKDATGPVFSPDGRTIAFTRSIDRPSPTTVAGKYWEEGFSGSSTWTIDLATGSQRRLTPSRHELRYVASSFSPDGSTLLATVEDDLLTNEPQPVALRIDGSGSRILFEDGSAPVYSPDGSKVAFTRRIQYFGEDGGEDVDLFVIDADGGGLRRLTRTPGRPELYPGWDPSGERLAYVRLSAMRSEEAPFGFRTALMHVNADGSCETTVVSARRTFFFGPVWQPGPGRGAGRIECR